MSRDGRTVAMELADTEGIVGLSCVACGAGERGISFPVITPRGEPRLPKLCTGCFTSLIQVASSNAVRVADGLAVLLLGVQVEGIMLPGT